MTDILFAINGSISGACSEPHCWASCLTPLLRISMRLLCRPCIMGLDTDGPVCKELSPGIVFNASPSVVPLVRKRSSLLMLETDKDCNGFSSISFDEMIIAFRLTVSSLRLKL